jgi:hypothetical protein
MKWKRNPELHSVSKLAFLVDVNHSIVLFNVSVDNRQPEAAAAIGIALSEPRWCECAGANFFWNTQSAIMEPKL